MARTQRNGAALLALLLALCLLGGCAATPAEESTRFYDYDPESGLLTGTLDHTVRPLALRAVVTPPEQTAYPTVIVKPPVLSDQEEAHWIQAFFGDSADQAEVAGQSPHVDDSDVFHCFATPDGQNFGYDERDGRLHYFNIDFPLNMELDLKQYTVQEEPDAQMVADAQDTAAALLEELGLTEFVLESTEVLALESGPVCYALLYSHEIAGLPTTYDSYPIPGTYQYYNGDNLYIIVIDGAVVYLTGFIREVVEVEVSREIIGLEAAMGALEKNSAYISLTTDVDIPIENISLRYAPALAPLEEDSGAYRLYPAWHFGPKYTNVYSTGQNLLDINAYDGSVLG